MEDPLDLWLLQGSIRSVDFWNSSWISFQLDGKITSRTLVYFKEFELTASGGVEIWYYLVPLSSAQFCLQWFSPTMVSMVRSYNCFACNRRFGNTCSARWSKWESFIIIGLVMYVFRKVCMGIQAGIEDTEVWDPCFLLWKTSDNLRHRSPVPWGKGLWDHCCLETLQWGLWRYLRLGDDKVTVLDAGRTDETDLEFQQCHRRPDGSVGMALPALTDCRWWFESLQMWRTDHSMIMTKRGRFAFRGQILIPSVHFSSNRQSGMMKSGRSNGNFFRRMRLSPWRVELIVDQHFL